VRATTINEEMKLAAVRAIAELARPSSRTWWRRLRPARTSLRPRVPDPEALRSAPDREIAPAVAKAAMDSGVATRPIATSRLREQLEQFVYHSGLLMKPVFAARARNPKRVVYAEGEDERVLRAVQVVVDEGIARPILVGRPAVIERRIERFGLRIAPGSDFELVNPDDDPRFNDYWQYYHELMQRKGVTSSGEARSVRRRAHADRRADGEARRCRCACVRHVRRAPQHLAVRLERDRAAAGRAKKYAAMNR
jgi:malate dehydrogenase (oxaloacetate-decarboxylating)(NADP+)